MKNKRGQGLSTNAIILIVLGVIVLVVLILGFTMGWDKIAPWIKPSNNVQEIADACSIACSTNAVYDYCTSERELKIEGKTTAKGSCLVLSGLNYDIGSCKGLCKKECVVDLKGVIKTTAQGCSDNEIIVDSLNTGANSICCVPSPIV